MGRGFTDQTAIRIEGIPNPLLQPVNHYEIRAAAPVAVKLDGLKITAMNPDQSRAVYYSYLRGLNLSPSTDPSLTNLIPIFASRLLIDAVAAPIVNGQTSGIAVQNPGVLPATVTVDAYSIFNQPIGSTSFTLAPSERRTRSVRELFPNVSIPPNGGYVRVRSAQGVQVVGLAADPSGAISPVPPTQPGR
jgi:hypothetical protein